MAYLNRRQEAQRLASSEIAQKFGQWDQTAGPDGAHYIQAEENVFTAEGLMCHNCVFYSGQMSCRIVRGYIEPEGICKLWIIPG